MQNKYTLFISWIAAGTLGLLTTGLAPAAAETPAETGFTAPAQRAPLKQEQIAANLRENLSPLIEATLQEHCGEDCPSFRVDPQFKKANTDPSIDDLGFSRPSMPEASPELQSVALSVLIQDKVSQKARESLRKILSNRITNAANVPVVVRMMTLDAFGPLMERRLQSESKSFTGVEKLELIKTFAWPTCILLLACAGFLALMRVLRHRREILFGRHASDQDSTSQAQMLGQAEGDSEQDSLILEILQSRAEDVRWLIEDAVLRSDKASIQKIQAIFPAQALTSRVQLSREALSTLASVTQAEVKKPDTQVISGWLTPALDRAHWGRMEEQADLLSRIRRYPANRAATIFPRLGSAGTRAAFITALPEERWPELLATLGSEERVQLGLALADYAATTSELRSSVASKLSQELIQADDPLATRSETALENFALYLSEKEGQKLWQEISLRSAAGRSNRKLAPASIESVFSDLNPSAAAEVCARLDVGTLSVVLTQMSGDVRARVYQNLPKTLQTRLESKSSAITKPPGEAEMMKARAAFMEAFRHFTHEGVAQ